MSSTFIFPFVSYDECAGCIDENSYSLKLFVPKSNCGGLFIYYQGLRLYRKSSILERYPYLCQKYLTCLRKASTFLCQRFLTWSRPMPPLSYQEKSLYGTLTPNL